MNQSAAPLQNRYRVIEAITERPDSGVYRAQDLQSGRDVVICMFTLADSTAHQTFETYARRLGIPGGALAQYLEDWFMQDGKGYLICVPGAARTLDRLMRQALGMTTTETAMQRPTQPNLSLEALLTNPPAPAELPPAPTSAPEPLPLSPLAVPEPEPRVRDLPPPPFVSDSEQRLAEPVAPPPPTTAASAPATTVHSIRQSEGFRFACMVTIALGATLLVVVLCVAMLLFLPGSPLRVLFAPATTPTPVATRVPAASIPTATPGPAATLRPTAVPPPAPTAMQPGANAITLENLETLTQTLGIPNPLPGPVAYSPDGNILAVGAGTSIWLYDGNSLQELRSLSGHTGGLTTLAWAPDGSILASGATNDPLIRIWNPATGEQIATLAAHTGFIRSLAFAPDNVRLASGGSDQTVRIWNARTGEIIQTLAGHTDMIGGLSFSPDSARLVSASRDGSVRLWDGLSGLPIDGFAFQTPTGPNGAPFWATAAVYSPDGTKIAIGATNNLIYVLDANSGAVLNELSGHTGWVVIRGIAFSPDSNTLLSAGLDGSVRAWNMADGQQLGVLEGHSLGIFGISLSPNGQLASASDQEGRVLIWDLSSGQPINRILVGQGQITSLAFAPDNTDLIGIVGYNGVIQLRQLSSEQAALLPGSFSASQNFGFISSNQFVGIDDDGNVLLQNISPPQTRQLSGLPGTPISIAASRDGRLVAAANEQGDIRIWDTFSSEVRTLRTQTPAAVRLTFNADGSLLAAVGTPDAPQVEVWDVAGSTLRYSFSDPGASIREIVFQPGGSLLAAISFDGNLYVWDVATGKRAWLASADADQGGFGGLAFSSDGSMLVSGTNNGTVQFWDVQTGRQRSRLQVADTSVLALAFSPNNEQLGICTRDGLLRVFSITGR